MGKRLTVIVGAGASYDCTSIGVTAINPDYRPPLTSGIFEGREPFQAILEKYPKARTLASTIAVRVNRGEPLEAALRSLRDSKESHIIRQFRQIPLFLQELFGEISIHHTSEPVNYTFLVNRLLASDFEGVAFVTLNYDLLLEVSLGTILPGSGTSWQPRDLDFYVEKGRKWMLVKLHGSANWGKRVNIAPRIYGSHEEVLNSVDALALTLDTMLDGDISVLSSHHQRWKPTGYLATSNLFYPALSVPVQGKYEFVCPRDHVEALRSFLSSCRNFLIIGVSGRDEDLVDLLKENITECAVVGIVEGNPRAAEEVAHRFNASVPQFACAEVRKVYTNGFSEFTTVKGNSLDDFLAYVTT